MKWSTCYFFIGALAVLAALAKPSFAQNTDIPLGLIYIPHLSKSFNGASEISWLKPFVAMLGLEKEKTWPQYLPKQLWIAFFRGEKGFQWDVVFMGANSLNPSLAFEHMQKRLAQQEFKYVRTTLMAQRTVLTYNQKDKQIYFFQDKADLGWTTDLSRLWERILSIKAWCKEQMQTISARNQILEADGFYFINAAAYWSTWVGKKRFRYWRQMLKNTGLVQMNHVGGSFKIDPDKIFLRTELNTTQRTGIFGVLVNQCPPLLETFDNKRNTATGTFCVNPATSWAVLSSIMGMKRPIEWALVNAQLGVWEEEFKKSFFHDALGENAQWWSAQATQVLNQENEWLWQLRLKDSDLAKKFFSRLFTMLPAIVGDIGISKHRTQHSEQWTVPLARSAKAPEISIAFKTPYVYISNQKIAIPDVLQRPKNQSVKKGERSKIGVFSFTIAGATIQSYLSFLTFSNYSHQILETSMITGTIHSQASSWTIDAIISEQAQRK